MLRYLIKRLGLDLGGKLEDATELLKETILCLEGSIKAQPRATILTDDAQIILVFNPAAEVMFGFDAEAATGQKVDILLPEDKRDVHGSHFKLFVRQGTTTRNMHQPGRWVYGRRRSGELFPVEATISRFWIDGIALCQVVLEDLGPRQQQNERLSQLLESERAAREEAEQANQAKMIFLAKMSHELRTPLNAITGFTEVLALQIHGELNKKQLEDLDRIDSNAKSLAGLVEDILDYAKLEAGQVRLLETTFSIEHDVQAAVIDPKFYGKSIACQAIAGDEKILVFADERRVTQILRNLVVNAIKFTDEGGVTLSYTADDNFVYVSVQDTGRGIGQMHHETIFESFRQLDPESLTGKFRGTGLGLTISRDLARLMGGDLTVESEVGKGATFTLKLRRQFPLPPIEDVDVLEPAD